MMKFTVMITHFYILLDWTKVNYKKEVCSLLRLGSNAFRNAVRRGQIEKIIENKPKGYVKEIQKYN